jgi:hypothetical protein
VNAVAAALAAFAEGDIADWEGLPPNLLVADLAEVATLDPADVRVGDTGDPARAGRWVPVATEHFAGGLRAWVDGDHVVALEGIHPLDGDGEFEPAPDLGRPDVALETTIGPLVLEGGERVYGARGLALRVNPANGLLLGIVGFTPTTADDYRTHVRPVPEVTRP